MAAGGCGDTRRQLPSLRVFSPASPRARRPALPGPGARRPSPHTPPSSPDPVTFAEPVSRGPSRGAGRPAGPRAAESPGRAASSPRRLTGPRAGDATPPPCRTALPRAATRGHRHLRARRGPRGRPSRPARAPARSSSRVARLGTSGGTCGGRGVTSGGVTSGGAASGRRVPPRCVTLVSGRRRL